MTGASSPAVPANGLGFESIAERRAQSRAPAVRRLGSRMPRPARIGLYVFLVTAAALFLLPLYVMIATSIKPMEEIRLGNLFALPVKITLEPWAQAWMSACTGLECGGIRAGFMNSVAIVIPSTVLSILQIGRAHV